jgi:hypothetical protein
MAAGAFLSVGTLLCTGLALAQQSAAPLVPVVTPLRSDDALGGFGAPRVDAAFAPLRLSLTGDLFPIESQFPGCESREDASGNSVHGFALQRYSFLRLTPRLVLHGYSMAGCAVDAGMGGGLTYSAPLSKDLWLVPSAGLYALPPVGLRPTLVSTAARVDIVKNLAWGGTLNFGLSTRQRTGNRQFTAVNFGGSF